MNINFKIDRFKGILWNRDIWIIWGISLFCVWFLPKFSLPIFGTDGALAEILGIFTVILTVFLLNATLALLSFTYLLVIKGNEDLTEYESIISKISLSYLKNYLNRITKKSDKITDDYNSKIKIYGKEENIPKSESQELDEKFKEIKKEIKQFSLYYKLYNYKSILRSGEYFFLNTIFLIIGFIFFIIYAFFFYSYPDQTTIIDFFYRLSAVTPIAGFLIFIRGIIAILKSFGHIGITKDS